MTTSTSLPEQTLFRDSRRMRTTQIISGSACVVFALLLVAGLFAPTKSASNPNGLTLTTKAVEVAVVALAVTAMAWMFRGARRARLVIGIDGVVIRNSWRTVHVQLSEVAGFVARGTTGVALARTDGSTIPVSAVSRRPGRRRDETLEQLNAAVHVGPPGRGTLEGAGDRPTVSVREASRIVRASLSPAELKWFASTVAFAINQARRKQSRLGRAAVQGGLMSAVHGAIAAQLTVTAGAFGWAAVAVETLHASSHLQLVVAAPLMVVLAGLAAAASIASLFETRKSGASKKLFMSGRGNDLFQLPPASGPPVPGPAWGGTMLCIWGADAIVTGWALESAKYVAPRATGLYFMAMGFVLLVLGIGIVQKAPKLTSSDQAGEDGYRDSVLSP